MTDCIVIGGGVIGLTSAYYLLKAGASVTVLEKNYYGKESSWAGAGILSPLYPWRYSPQVNQLSQQSQAIYPQFCSEIYQQTGIDSGYRPSGLLIGDDYKTETVKNFLEQNSIKHLFTSNGLLLPEIAQVRNPWFLQGIRALVSKQGGRLLDRQVVSRFVVKNKLISGVVSADKTYLASNVIVCGGAWSSELLSLLAEPLEYFKGHNLKEDIFPLKGQILLFEFAKNISLDAIVEHIFLAEDKYLVPRADNLLLVGASYENSGFDKSLNTQSAKLLRDFALKYVAGLDKAKLVKQWSGLRPATHSGLIHIQRLLPYQNLYLNAGHFSNGINTALASGQKITELIV